MKTITSNELKKMQNQNEDFTLINVLAEKDFQEEHIPGSLNIPVEKPDFLDRVAKSVKGKAEKIVVYCANLECQASPTAAQKLVKAGYTNVIDFEGGVRSWKESHQPVESSA